MKEKKIKRKQFHKIPTVILAVVVLVSVLALSAFADNFSVEKFEHADCSCMEAGYSDSSIYYWCEEHGIINYPITKVVEASDRCYDYEQVKGDLSFSEYAVDEDGYYYVDVYYSYCGDDGDYICPSCGEENCTKSSFLLYSNPKYIETTPTVPEAPKGIAQTITKDVTSAVGVFLKGIGSTLTNFFDNVVLTTNAEGQRVLSTFAGWTLAFVGIGFGAGLLRKLLKKVN